MKNSVVIGKIKGIEIEVNFSWLIIFGLVTYMLATSYLPGIYPDWAPSLRWIVGGIMALLLFTSVLLHELSHSFVSKSLGIQVKKISLFIFGGIAQMEGEPDEPTKELKIAIAGPAMSLFLAALFILLANRFGAIGAPKAIIAIVTYMYSINLVLAIFNLIPAFPMDGGRVLRAIIWHFSGNLEKATKIASYLGGVFGYFLIFLGIFWMFNGDIINGIWFLFIGWFIHQSSQSSYQYTVMTNRFSKIHVSEFMTEKIVIVDYQLSIQELVDSYFYKYKFANFPVRKNKEIMGIVNIESVKKIPKESWSQTTVGSITTPLEDNLIVSPDDPVSTAMEKLFANDIGKVLVMNQSKLIGMISKADMLNYMRIQNQLSQ